MSKLSDYTKEEVEAVYQLFFGDTNIKRGDLTPKQMLDLMTSFNGSRLVIRMRFRKMWEEIKKAFREGFKK